MKDLNKAQDQLDEKEKELEAVQAQYDQAMSEKQVRANSSLFNFCFSFYRVTPVHSCDQVSGCPSQAGVLLNG